MDKAPANSDQRRMKDIKKFKRKQWLSRKKEQRRKANREDRRQKFMQKYVKQTELEGDISASKAQKVEVCTQVNFDLAVNEAKPSNANVSSLPRGREMVESARNKSTKKASFKLPPSNEDNKKIPAIVTNRKVLATAADKRKKMTRETPKIKELEPGLLSIEEVRALGQGTFGICFLATYRNIVVAVKEYLDKSGKKSLASLQICKRRSKNCTRT